MIETDPPRTEDSERFSPRPAARKLRPKALLWFAASNCSNEREKEKPLTTIKG
jgi:hypothetical protein